MYHGIIIDQEFNDLSFPQKQKIFNEKQDGDWHIYGIEIEDERLQETISQIQQNMKDGPWYVHLYNDSNLIVVFKDKIFRINPSKSTWESAIEHGIKLNIPEEQLNFQPNRFQDERHYFKV